MKIKALRNSLLIAVIGNFQTAAPSPWGTIVHSALSSPFAIQICPTRGTAIGRKLVADQKRDPPRFQRWRSAPRCCRN